MDLRYGCQSKIQKDIRCSESQVRESTDERIEVPAFLLLVISRLKMLLNYPPFRTKVAEAAKIPASLPDKTFITKVSEWAKANPTTSATVFSSALLTVPSILTDVFTPEEITEIAKGIQDSTKLGTYESKNLISNNLGDGKEGSAYGKSTDEVLSAVDLVKTSLSRTERLAHLLTIRPEEVAEFMKLIAVYEPEDGLIYSKYKQKEL